MEKFESTIEAIEESAVSARQGSSERPESDGAGFERGGSSLDSGFMNREEALWELREIALKDPVDDFDDKEDFRRILSLWKTVGGDPMIDLEVSKILSRVRDSSYEELGMNFLEEGKKFLKEIQLNTKSALVKLWIDSTLRVPFEGVDLERKREFLKESWEHVCAFVVSNEPHLFEKYFDKPNSILDNADPQDIEYLFSGFREESFSWFRYEDGREMFDRFHEPELTEKYNLPLPNIPKWYTEEIPSEQGRIVSSISEEYGVVYSTGFSAEYFFALDRNREDAESKDEKKPSKRLTAENMLRAEGISELKGKEILNVYDLSKLYTTLIEPFFRKKIEDDFGIELKDFSVRVQVQFLNFLFEKNEEEVKRVMKFIQDGNSIDRLKSFLSLEQGGESMGEAILAIGEKLPKEAADKVFAKYAEMAEVAQSAAKYVEQSLRSPEKSNPEAVARVAETLLVRAKDILVEFSEIDVSEEQHLQELYTKLDSIQSDIELYKATLTAFARSGEPLGLDDMEQSRFEAVHAEALSDMDRGVMRDMYLRNIAGSPERVRAKLLANLDRNFENPDATFYVFRYENRVEGFLCFSQDQEGKALGEKFGSAFNVNPDFQKGTIGMMMHEEATNREAKKFAIRIECLPGKRSSARYIESGFAGTRLWNDDGEMVLDAVRDDRKKENFHSKVLSREEIMTRDGGEERDGVLALSFERAEDIPFDQYIGTYVLTRYFFDEQRKRWFLVFEKRAVSEP